MYVCMYLSQTVVPETVGGHCTNSVSTQIPLSLITTETIYVRMVYE